MNFNFDRTIDRRSSNSMKWRRYSPDVLPMWSADMDFEAPPAVIEAIRKQAEHGVYGYPVFEPTWLKEIVAERMLRLYGWHVNPDEVLLVPGVVTGFNWVSHAIGQPGDEILVQTPIYPPILSAPENSNRVRIDLELTRLMDGSYVIDFDSLEQCIRPQTRLFLLCNPHNPTGRVFTRAELERMAEICLRHNIIICSDEIHGELVYSEHRHIPIASLNPEIAAQSITLIAPSKTFNVAGWNAPSRSFRTKNCVNALKQLVRGWFVG